MQLVSQELVPQNSKECFPLFCVYCYDTCSPVAAPVNKLQGPVDEVGRLWIKARDPAPRPGARKGSGARRPPVLAGLAREVERRQGSTAVAMAIAVRGVQGAIRLPRAYERGRSVNRRLVQLKAAAGAPGPARRDRETRASREAGPVLRAHTDGTRTPRRHADPPDRPARSPHTARARASPANAPRPPSRV